MWINPQAKASLPFSHLRANLCSPMEGILKKARCSKLMTLSCPTPSRSFAVPGGTTGPRHHSPLGAQTRHRRLPVATRIMMAIACLVVSLPAVASTSTSTMAVSATVVASCTLTTTPMAFGNYSSALATSTATVTATCTNTTPYNIGLSAGLATGATVTTRGMFVSGSPSIVLNYGLYSNAARTTNWGVTIGTDTVTGTGNGAAQAITVYGQVPAGQLVAPGSYTDTITATITY